jgi:hypothetical protein
MGIARRILTKTILCIIGIGIIICSADLIRIMITVMTTIKYLINTPSVTNYALSLATISLIFLVLASFLCIFTGLFLIFSKSHKPSKKIKKKKKWLLLYMEMINTSSPYFFTI